MVGSHSDRKALIVPQRFLYVWGSPENLNGAATPSFTTCWWPKVVFCFNHIWGIIPTEHIICLKGSKPPTKQKMSQCWQSNPNSLPNWLLSFSRASLCGLPTWLVDITPHTATRCPRIDWTWNLRGNPPQESFKLNIWRFSNHTFHDFPVKHICKPNPLESIGTELAG